MSDWQKLYASNSWSTLDHWWRHEASDEEARAFWEKLMADIPKIHRQNGMERALVPIRPQDAVDALKKWEGAAYIVEMGELASRVFEDKLRAEAAEAGWQSSMSKDASLLWAHLREQILDDLNRLEQSEEETTGDPELSRAAHIDDARERLAELDRLIRAASAAMGSDPAEQNWMSETMTEAVHLSLLVGMSLRAALGKSIEAHAVRGEKSLKAAYRGGDMQRAAFAAARREIIESMTELLNQGLSVSQAARKIARARGKSEKAISNTFYRYRE